MGTQKRVTAHSRDFDVDLVSDPRQLELRIDINGLIDRVQHQDIDFVRIPAYSVLYQITRTQVAKVDGTLKIQGFIDDLDAVLVSAAFGDATR